MMTITRLKPILLLALILSVFGQPLHAAIDYSLCQLDSEEQSAMATLDHDEGTLDVDEHRTTHCCDAGCSGLFASAPPGDTQTPASEFKPIDNDYNFVRLPRLDRPPSLT